MAGPAPIQRGWPDFQDPAGAGSILLTAQSLNFTDSVTFGPFDVSTYESLNIRLTRTSGTSTQGYYRTQFAYVDTTGTVVNLGVDQCTFSNNSFPTVYDYHSCQGPLAYFTVVVGSLTNFQGVLRVVGKNGPLQPSVQSDNPILFVQNAAVPAGGNIVAYASTVRRGWAQVLLRATVNTWTMYLEAINSAGQWRTLSFAEGRGLQIYFSDTIVVPPAQTRFVIYNTGGVPAFLEGTLYMSGT